MVRKRWLLPARRLFITKSAIGANQWLLDKCINTQTQREIRGE
jgi:hypothetical protein